MTHRATITRLAARGERHPSEDRRLSTTDELRVTTCRWRPAPQSRALPWRAHRRRRSVLSLPLGSERALVGAEWTAIPASPKARSTMPSWVIGRSCKGARDQASVGSGLCGARPSIRARVSEGGLVDDQLWHHCAERRVRKACQVVAIFADATDARRILFPRSPQRKPEAVISAPARQSGMSLG